MNEGLLLMGYLYIVILAPLLKWIPALKNCSGCWEIEGTVGSIGKQQHIYFNFNPGALKMACVLCIRQGAQTGLNCAWTHGGSWAVHTLCADFAVDRTYLRRWVWGEITGIMTSLFKRQRVISTPFIDQMLLESCRSDVFLFCID